MATNVLCRTLLCSVTISKSTIELVNWIMCGGVPGQPRVYMLVGVWAVRWDMCCVWAVRWDVLCVGCEMGYVLCVWAVMCMCVICWRLVV